MIDRSAHGSRTEAGFTVGEFTLEGTLELVIFVGLFTGLLVTPIWVIVERWLPSRGLARVAAAGVVAIGLGGRFGIEGDNFDFRILDPPLVQAAIFVLLAGATGAAVVLADRFIDRRLPVAKSETPTGGWWVLIFLGAFPTLLLIMSFFSEEISGGVSAPRLVGAFFLALGLVTVYAFVREARGGELQRWVWIGRAILVATVVAGMFHLGGEIAHFA